MIDKNLEKILHNSLEQNKISHCYLLCASPKINVDESVLYFINKLNNSNIQSLDENTLPANVLYLKDTLSKEKITSVLESSSLSPFSENTYKIIVLRNIDNASSNALNAMLKSIEEPSSKTVFLLTTNRIKLVLPTILSRSVVIHIKSPSYTELEKELMQNGYNEEQAKFYSYIFADISQAKELLKPESYDLVQELVQTILLSLKNKYYLYIFLTQFCKKDKKETFLFLILCLKFLFTLTWSKKVIMNPNMKKLAKKLIGVKIDFFAIFKAIEDFLRSVETNENYFLQAERLLTKIMGAYE
ncbi:DNA polymerase III subunit delta' [Mycoplasmopsis primatum]|uniref:DNA polymerase III subunit delta' n=1 Tax=Mycoplasmopsis primatum TaxID=55604 RepID=UPI0004973565|nr:DNA polymerase III subunit delta' [Mycoplasmopsis primatum]